MFKKIIFDPLKNANEDFRAKFWDDYAESFVPITGALSTQSYLGGEIYLCEKYLKPKNKSGKFLKLDLWNEVNHTPVIDNIWMFYDEIHGIDIAPKLVKKAIQILKQKKIPLKAKLGDIRKLPYKSNYFDYVYTMGTIEHIPDPSVAIEEIYRVLKPGGIAVIGVPNKYEWFGKSIVLDILSEIGAKKDNKEFSFGWKNLTKLLETNGFIIKAKTGTYFMPWFIRLIDWYLYQKSPRLKYVMFLPIKFCDLLSKINFFRSHGSLLAPVVIKPNKYDKKNS